MAISHPVLPSLIMKQVEFSRALRAEAARLRNDQSELAHITRQLRSECRNELDQVIAVFVEMRACHARVRKNHSFLTSMGF